MPTFRYDVMKGSEDLSRLDDLLIECTDDAAVAASVWTCVLNSIAGAHIGMPELVCTEKISEQTHAKEHRLHWTSRPADVARENVLRNAFKNQSKIIVTLTYGDARSSNLEIQLRKVAPRRFFRAAAVRDAAESTDDFVVRIVEHKLRVNFDHGKPLTLVDDDDRAVERAALTRNADGTLVLSQINECTLLDRDEIVTVEFGSARNPARRLRMKLQLSAL